eukprot:176300-Pleurochrysis_carterae.AAC.1
MAWLWSRGAGEPISALHLGLGIPSARHRHNVAGACEVRAHAACALEQGSANACGGGEAR